MRRNMRVGALGRIVGGELCIGARAFGTSKCGNVGRAPQSVASVPKHAGAAAGPSGATC